MNIIIDKNVCKMFTQMQQDLICGCLHPPKTKNYQKDNNYLS